MNKRQHHLISLGALLLAVICWGLAPVSTRYLLKYLNPLHLLILRFCVAALLFLPLLVTAYRKRWTRNDLLLLLVCSLTGIIGYNVLVTFGIHFIPAGTAGLIIATEAIWIALFSVLLFHERLHWTVIAGLFLAFIGVGILLGWTAFSSSISVLEGFGLTLLGAIMWSIYTVLIRGLSRKYGALLCSGITTIIGAIPLLFFSDGSLFSHLTTLPLTVWGAFFLLAIGSTVIATILWNYGLKSIPVSQAGLFLYLIPFISVTAAGIFLRESISPGMLLGGVFIIIGVVLAQLQLFTKSTLHTHIPDSLDKEPATPI
jgi:drug/metabolite transporter (DMT)-like permease